MSGMTFLIKLNMHFLFDPAILLPNIRLRYMKNMSIMQLVRITVHNDQRFQRSQMLITRMDKTVACSYNVILHGKKTVGTRKNMDDSQNPVKSLTQNVYILHYISFICSSQQINLLLEKNQNIGCPGKVYGGRDLLRRDFRLLLLSVLGVKPRISGILSKCSTTELISSVSGFQNVLYLARSLDYAGVFVKTQ